MLGKRLAERELKLEVSDEALALISEAGFDPLFGARPLKRAIQHGIENPLAQQILSGAFSEHQTIAVNVEDEKLVFNAS